MGADSLVLMSDVNGIYTLPPSQEGARLLHTYSPSNNGFVTFGGKSRVGLGGMESKVKSAAWALDRGVSVVICNGTEELAISKIFAGKRVGTFFTQFKHETVSVQSLASNGKWIPPEITLLCNNISDKSNSSEIKFSLYIWIENFFCYTSITFQIFTF